jgi:two-component system response regulator AtoC
MVKKAQVAIVDDDSILASSLKSVLTSRGYDATCYTRGEELLAAMKQHNVPDIVLLDVVPGLDGLTTLKALKASWPQAEAIVLSAGLETPALAEAAQLGASEFVVKPDEPARLDAGALDTAIAEAIDKRRLCAQPGWFDEGDCWVSGISERMRAISHLVDQVADSDVTVLLRGESGVGKELVARALHQRSTRHLRAYVKVNCATLPSELLESELFGHERGAFTGAAAMRLGKFEQADAGTLVLDEIGEMTPALQAKLLHVLQDGEFTRLGSNKRIRVDVRVIAATNRNLERMMTSRDFREDLYYRLKVIEMTIPALRERREEIPMLTDFFLSRYSRKYHRPMRPLSAALRQQFAEYDWPGNIRELENMIKRLVVLQEEQLVLREIQGNIERRAGSTAVLRDVHASAGHRSTDVAPFTGWRRRIAPAVPTDLATAPDRNPVREEDRDAPDPPDVRNSSLVAVAKAAALRAERAAITRTLEQVHWNRRKAAQILGVSYKTLLNKIKECGISQA